MDQFSEEEMGSGFMAQPSLHIVLCMDCAWKHFWIMLVIIFLKTRDLETPQEYLQRQRIMAKWRGRKRREGKKIT